MLINVYHKDMSNEVTEKFEKVAAVSAPGGDTTAALEFAYRWTNNFGGSWSRKEKVIGDAPNHDMNNSVTVLTELPVINGKTYGLRSTSMFDEMEIPETGERFRVAMCGFEKV